MSEHGHGHNPNLAHHFDSMDQQNNAGKLGMWLFLATEVLLFAGLFCAYAVFRANNPEVFQYASTYLNVWWGALNTIVLLASSFTIAMAVRSSQLGQKDKTSMFLVLTLVGAAAFMVIKGIEYSAKFAHGTLPGAYYMAQDEKEYEYEGRPTHHEAEATGEEAAGPATVKLDAGAAKLVAARSDARTPWGEDEVLSSHTSQVKAPPSGAEGLSSGDEPPPTLTEEQVRNVHWFFGIYFLLTGTHGLHVIFGGIAITWVLMRNMRGDFDETYNLPVDLVGLYWHLVDLIWIYLFPLLYLINVREQGMYGLH